VTVIDAYVGRIPWTRGSAGSPLPTFRTRIVGDVVAAITWLRQAYCGLGGHVMVKRFEPGRVSLECLSCGGQTRGWDIQR
jgi:hypothetical protein